MDTGGDGDDGDDGDVNHSCGRAAPVKRVGAASKRPTGACRMLAVLNPCDAKSKHVHDPTHQKSRWLYDMCAWDAQWDGHASLRGNLRGELQSRAWDDVLLFHSLHNKRGFCCITACRSVFTADDAANVAAKVQYVLLYGRCLGCKVRTYSIVSNGPPSSRCVGADGVPGIATAMERVRMAQLAHYDRVAFLGGHADAGLGTHEAKVHMGQVAKVHSPGRDSLSAIGARAALVPHVFAPSSPAPSLPSSFDPPPPSPSSSSSPPSPLSLQLPLPLPTSLSAPLRLPATPPSAPTLDHVSTPCSAVPASSFSSVSSFSLPFWSALSLLSTPPSGDGTQSFDGTPLPLEFKACAESVLSCGCAADEHVASGARGGPLAELFSSDNEWWRHTGGYRLEHGAVRSANEHEAPELVRATMEAWARDHHVRLCCEHRHSDRSAMLHDIS